ncbi:TetR/AcrR family transcriptional regulator [Ignavigranum ruoffiae]|uniref:TetR/AcrR family transcriptional regulator n=1 Tax=Ignavigranum ruoffiae TaxID=89093 RepID=UPI00206061B6|nr:TetR/AcrR family transcriptional regulator [Ignavigranum ruoffiae]UPQ85163.1 TetR/AcrR family transcriptional regulator [Ignavigranum ruoffiae]
MSQRQTKTKEKIKQVLIKLVKEKGLANVTVSDIAREAQINRGTFYLHYIDKFDLIEKLETEAINDLSAILLAEPEKEALTSPIELFPYSLILQTMYYIKDNYAFIATMTQQGHNQEFMEQFKNILKQLIQQKLDRHHIQLANVSGLSVEYADEILSSSILAIVTLWVRRELKETPEEIAEMIVQTKHYGPYQIIQKY